MITASDYFKTFSWKKIFPGKTIKPLLSDEFDSEMWRHKFVFNLSAYEHFVQATEVSPEGQGFFYLEPDGGDVILKPLDDSWLSNELLQPLFKRLVRLPLVRQAQDFDGQKSYEFNISGPTENGLANGLILGFALAIFYLAIHHGHKNLPLKTSLRIDNSAAYLYYQIGSFVVGVTEVLTPRRERLSKAAEALSKIISDRQQPVIEAYYKLPLETKRGSLYSIIKEVHKLLEKEMQAPSSKDTIERYLKKEGIIKGRGNVCP
jgi:hypothetical protein